MGGFLFIFMNINMNKWFCKQSFFLLFFCAVVTACYSKGMTGSFIFDDFGSLPQLGNHNVIDSLDKLKAYVFGGVTGPGGRPIALLSFAANAQTWPADPYFFLVTNIAIHILNILLLFWFLTIFSEEALPQLKNKNLVVIVACALWALHPFHVSTVLYVVQRMTLLATTFSLLTFISYLYARRALLARRYIKGVLVLFIGALCAGFGFFSKETVVLLPLQILLIEFLCNRVDGSSRNTLLSWVFWVCLIPAAIVVAGYPVKLLIGNVWSFITTGAELGTTRSFTMFERLLTEQRVVGDYIIDLLIPKIQSAGVFFDGYTISKSLMSPLSTLLWVLLHLGLLLGAFVLRRKYTVVFFCIWWFYAGHLMESTTPMLEIKFDHRNYLPSIGLMLLFAYAISCLKNRVLGVLVSISLVSVYAILLSMGASLWGKPLEAAMVWVEKNPNSPRALEHAASLYYSKYGATEEAEKLLLRSIEVAPKVDAELKFIGVFCKTYNGQAANWVDFAERVKTSDRDWSLYTTLQYILNNYISGTCSEFDLMGYLSVLNAYKTNPAYSKTTSVYLMDDLAIKAALEFDQVDLAKQYVNKSNEVIAPLAFQINRALSFANYGEVEYATNLLSRAITIAEQLNYVDKFTMSNAKEILQLMQADLGGAESE